jgi:TRAP-type C4-dicarboxylate transport system permease small subunit
VSGLVRAARAFDRALRGLAALLLALIVALVAASAIGRYLLQAPARFIEELSGLLMVSLLFLALAVPGREGHIRVGFVADRVKGPARHVLRAAALAVLLGFAGIFGWDAAEQARFNFERNIRTELGGIPIWPWSLLMPVSLAILSLRALVAWIAGGDEAAAPARDIA